MPDIQTDKQTDIVTQNNVSVRMILKIDALNDAKSIFKMSICRSLCYCLVDLISHPNGRYPREDGAPGHTVPGAGQHL